MSHSLKCIKLGFMIERQKVGPAILNTVADSTKYFHIHDFSYVGVWTIPPYLHSRMKSVV